MVEGGRIVLEEADHAHAQLARRGEAAIDGHPVPPGAHLVDGGQAVIEAVRDAETDAALGLRRTRRRDHVAHEVGAVVDEHAGRFAAGVAVDGAAGRVGRVAVDAGQAQRGRVDPRRMAIDPAQHDRAIGRHRVELPAGRPGGAWPPGLVPAAAQKPALALGRGGLGHLGGAGGGVGQAAHVDLGQGLADAVEVGVAVDQAGNRDPAVEVDDLRPLPREGQCGAVVAHQHDPSVGDGQRRGAWFRLGLQHGHHPPTVEDEVDGRGGIDGRREGARTGNVEQGDEHQQRGHGAASRMAGTGIVRDPGSRGNQWRPWSLHPPPARVISYHVVSPPETTTRRGRP